MSRACAFLTLLTTAVLSAQRALLVAGEDSCPAGSNAASCRPESAVASSSTAPTPALAPKADLITQELQELEAIKTFSAERIVLLKELQAAMLSGHNLSVPESHVRALREKVPLVSDLAAGSEAGPTAASEDYLVSKAVIPQEEPVIFIKFLPLRNPSKSSSSSESTQTTMPSALLVAVQADSKVRLFTPSGALVLTFSAGHAFPVTHLAVSPSHDEYLLATGDSGGVIRVHKVAVNQRRHRKEKKEAHQDSADEKVSQYLGSSVNVTAQLQRQMQVPIGSDGEASRITSLAMASQSGSKFFVAGDAEGKVSVFTKNGTFRAKIDVSSMPETSVDSLDSYMSSLLFRAGSEWGFIELDKMQVRHLDCQPFEGHVTSAVMDSQHSSRVLVADEDGSIWVLNVKSKKDCRVELKFAKGATHAPIELASVRGFVIGLEHGKGTGDPASVVALNISQASKRNQLGQGPSSVVWRRSRPAVRSWAVHKRQQQGDLIASLSEDGHEIEIMELLMQVYTVPATDSFGNFKLPVIAIAVVLVLGYQYTKQKGKWGGKSGGLGGKKLDFNSEEFASALKNKRKPVGGGLQSKRFS